MNDAENSARTGRSRRPGRFKPGESGNPGGRPKGLRALIHEAVGHDGEKLVQFWELIAFGDDAAIKAQLGTKQAPRWADRMTALEELANRGFGKPTLPIDHELSGGVELTWLTGGTE